MKTYRADFTGRTVGAIGITYKIKTTVQGDNLGAAQLALYDRFEHISALALTEQNDASSLYEELTEAGVQIANHESDLYFPATEKALAILARHQLENGNAKYFINQAPPNVGERWVDVPFAFQPFWTAKEAR